MLEYPVRFAEEMVLKRGCEMSTSQHKWVLCVKRKSEHSFWVVLFHYWSRKVVLSLAVI